MEAACGGWLLFFPLLRGKWPPTEEAVEGGAATASMPRVSCRFEFFPLLGRGKYPTRSARGG